MDIQQAKILLEKINALQKNINTDGGDLARIERDLMLSYIRQLYETYLEAEVPAAVTRSTPKTYSAPPPAPKPVPKVVEPVKAPPPPPQPEPVVEVAPPPPPPPAPKPAPAPSTKGSPAVEALFRIKEAKELSEKLSQQGIKDLTKAMSINDKLLYSNELFDRDMASMTATLQQLNGLSSLNEAKAVLIPIAEKNNWTEDERADVAQSFIKLVRRKY